MKKKVRIYKATDGKGKYVNKTSKFLAKAQMGGTPDPSMLAYPGSQPSQEEDQTNQLIQFIVNDITNQVNREETMFKLVNIMGIPLDTASQLYMTIAEKITEDIEKEDDATYEEETGEKRKKETPLPKEEVITQNPEEEDFDYDLYDDTGSDIAMQESEGPDVLDEALDPLAEQKYGGSMRTYRDGGEYDVALPDAESYASIVQPMMGYDLVSEMAWNSGEDSDSPYLQEDFANTTLDYSKLQKGGAYKKAKKKYVNSVMNLLKKQMGGTNESDVNPNQGDPTGSNYREGKLKLFTDTVKKNAEMSAMQNQIEQQYDQMMQEGGVPMPEQDVENPMHHLQLYSQATSGIFGEPMNETVKARKGLFVKDDDLPVQNEDLLNIPRGFYRRSMRRFGNIPNLREVDVRKSGLFGPKQYTMYFDPLPLQQLSNPLAAQMYGYGSGYNTTTKKVRTFDAVKTYTNLATDAVNQESLKEVDKNTPGNEATTVKEDVASGPTAPVVAKLKPRVASAPVPVVQETVMRDEWGRPSTSKWYGFNAKTKTWDPKYGPHKYMFDPAPGVTNIARGIASYKESPYVIAFRNQTQNTINSLLSKQTGGVIQDPFSNPMEPLQRFVGGGYDPSIPDLTENDIQYMNSKDITDAYMQGGGFIKNFIPANLTRSAQNDVVQRVYNPVTGQTYSQVPPGAARQISAIDVKKRGITGRPKKYTIYYGGAGSMPPKITTEDKKDDTKKDTKTQELSAKEQALANAGYGQRTDVTGLKAKSKRAIKQGERQRDRDLEKLYKEDPTNVAFDPMNLDAPFDRTASNNRAYNVNDLVETTTEEDFATWGEPKGPMEATTAYQFPEGEVDDSGWGMPQDIVVGPSNIPVNTTTPAPIAKPATGKQTEEFCFGNTCFDVPEHQRDEYDLFYETPALFGEYARNNKVDWYDPETGDIDLSKVDAETARKIIKQGLSKNPVLKNRSFEGANIDAYSDAWLKYSQDNQNVYGSTSLADLMRDESALPSHGLAEKYADFMNATGKTAEGKPFSIWDATGPLGFNEQEAAQLVQQPNVPKRMTSDFVPMGMEGPMATAEDQVPTFEEQYMEGFQPTITQDMINEASGLRIPQEPVDMGAWSGMAYPGVPFEPGMNPFDLPIGGGQDYYPPFAQPTVPIVSRNNQSVNRPAPSGPSLEQIRNQQRRNPNAGKDYSFTPNMSGMQKDPDYVRAMNNARKDGVITNQESENAKRAYKQKLAEQEKAKVASQAQRTINQIMSSSAPASEKAKAREKVVLQMQQRWDEIDRTATSRKYGGALSRFVGGGSQSFTGENPVGYTNNPAVGNTEAYNFNTLSNPSTEEDFATWGIPGMPNEKMEKMATLPASAGLVGFAKGTEQLAGTNTPLAIDVKNKLSQGEREARLITGNALMRGVAGFKNRIDDSKQMADFYDNFSADNLYASDPSRDRGDYAESGLYRPDEQGQTWYGRSAQMGGYIDDDFEDGEEVYMTDEEIKEYMANGGQIEFI